jgi:hypothetical protein
MACNQVRSYKRMPPELWDRVIDGLPSLTGRYAADVFQFTLQAQHKKHSDILKLIIRDDESWTLIARRLGLRLALLGDDLHALYNDPTLPAYLALLTGDNTKSIRHDKTKLFKALQPHHRNENNEVVFANSRIILSVDEAVYNPFFVTLDPKRLFGYGDDKKLRSASLYLEDRQYALRTIQEPDIVGVGDGVLSLRDVSDICGVTLTHPREVEMKRRYQQCFQSRNCLLVFPLCPVGYRFNGDNILGWEWGDGNPGV